jgi:hypothetical protein
MPARSRQREHRNARIVALVKKQMQQKPDAIGVHVIHTDPMVVNAYHARMAHTLLKAHPAVCLVVLPLLMDTITRIEHFYILLERAKCFAVVFRAMLATGKRMATAHRVPLATTATAGIRADVSRAHTR